MPEFGDITKVLSFRDKCCANHAMTDKKYTEHV
jgi:hypothetical protein